MNRKLWLFDIVPLLFLIINGSCEKVEHENLSNQIKIPSNNTSYPEDEFVGVYSECIIQISFTCLQKKTLKYLIKLEEEKELPIFGNYLSFVKHVKDEYKRDSSENEFEYITDRTLPSPVLAKNIDKKIEEFFNTHLLRIKFGNYTEELNLSNVFDMVESRKKKDDNDKKKMMMMAMMMMKMKVMMMIPAMMGIIGIMSLKGILLGGLALIISKILLLMKIMGAMGAMGGKGGSGGHGGSDAGWMGASGGGGGGWMAGRDTSSSGGGGGGGYNAQGEWQSRSEREIYNHPKYYYHQEK